MQMIKHATLSVDYLTATASTVSQLEAFDTIAQTEITNRIVQGYEADAFKFYGYEGWRIGEFAYGTRYDGALIKVWGDRADDLWREAALYAGNVTRLDICIDCLLETAKLNFAQSGYRALAMDKGRLSYSLVTGSDHGETLYLGARSSEKFARLYDKGIETKSLRPGLWWRYELEIKGKSAHIATREILAKDFDSQIEFMADLVQKFFTDAGIEILFPRGKGAIVSRVSSNGLAGDDSLDWLRRQVRPSVQRLVGLGRLEETLKALGLDEIVTQT